MKDHTRISKLVAQTYSNIGDMYKGWGKLDKAEMYGQKGLELKKQIFGELHILTAISYSNLGSLYKEMGTFLKSKEHYQKALEIRISILGPRHPDTLRIPLFVNIKKEYEHDSLRQRLKFRDH